MQAPLLRRISAENIDISVTSSHQPRELEYKKAEDATIIDKSKQECFSPAHFIVSDGVKLYKKLLESSKHRTAPFKAKRENKQTTEAQASEQTKIKFNRHNLLSIFCQDIRSSDISYVASAGEHINFQLFFNYLLEQLTYLERMTARPEKLVKIKTTILKRAIDEYCDEYFPRKGEPAESSRKMNKRLNKEDQIRYEHAQLPIPPSRMQSEYINRLFENRGFRQYYMQYIKTDKLRKYLTTISRRAIEFFKDNMMMLLTKNYGIRAVIEAYEHTPNPPLFYRQIKIYLRQAHIIAKNLIRNLKLQQMKILREIKDVEEGYNQSFDLQLWEKKNYIEELYPEKQDEFKEKLERKRSKKAIKSLQP